MKTLKIGIVGAGGIVISRHLPGLRQLDGIEIAAVANSTAASAASFCESHAPEARVIGDWRDLVCLPELDVVWIGATPHLHQPATLAALAAGKHVFCQARMARDLAEADSMLAAAAEHPDLVTMLCPPPHGLRGDTIMKNLLADDLVGPLRVIRLRSANAAWLDPTSPLHWRQRRDISGLNVMTLGIHTEVIQRWLGDFTVLAAKGQTFTAVRPGGRVDTPDVLHVLARFPDDAACTMEFSGVHSGDPVDQIDISGTRGVVVYDFLTDEIRVQRPGQTTWQTLTIPHELAGGWTVERDFVAAVRDASTPRPHPDFHDGVRYMRVVQKVGELLSAN